MKEEHSEAFLKRRKFLTVLPVIVIPFLVLLFWLLGGARGGEKTVVVNKGLNTQLPDANLKKESTLDKLSFYAQADQDSVNRAQQMRMDPNYQAPVTAPEKATELDRKVMRLSQEVDNDREYEPRGKKTADPEIERLQNMVNTLQQSKTDPDIEALNGTLDKLLEMQNPKQDMAQMQKGVVYPVSAAGVSGDISFFGKIRFQPSKGFLNDEHVTQDSATGRAIMAVIHNEQTIQDGSVVKLRLSQDVYVNGQIIHVGSFVYGNVSLENERLQVKIVSIQYGQRLFPVALKVYDIDGLEGIHIPGSAGRQTIKQSAEQGIQSSSILTFDPSLKAQAAAVGVNAAKSLLSKKVKLERVTVKAGYQVLLKDENERSYSW